MGALSVILSVLVCLGLLALIAWQVTKIAYAIKSKGETLKEKSLNDDQDKSKKEE